MNKEMEPKGRSVFAVKNIIRLLAFFCLIFVFCPSFLVSCTGQEVNINVMTVVDGMSMYGEKVVEPHPIMLICIIIPTAMLMILFVKRFTDKNVSVIVAALAVIDIAVWIVFRATVKKLAEENYCTFKTTVWYVFNIIALILIIGISILVFLNKIEMDMDVISRISSVDMQSKLDQITKAVNTISGQVSENASNVATNVSKENNDQNVHNEERLANNEKVKTTSNFCQQCGAKLTPDSLFCESCGTKVE